MRGTLQLKIRIIKRTTKNFIFSITKTVSFKPQIQHTPAFAPNPVSNSRAAYVCKGYTHINIKCVVAVIKKVEPCTLIWRQQHFKAVNHYITNLLVFFHEFTININCSRFDSHNDNKMWLLSNIIKTEFWHISCCCWVSWLKGWTLWGPSVQLNANKRDPQGEMVVCVTVIFFTTACGQPCSIFDGNTSGITATNWQLRMAGVWGGGWGGGRA